MGKHNFCLELLVYLDTIYYFQMVHLSFIGERKEVAKKSNLWISKVKSFLILEKNESKWEQIDYKWYILLKIRGW